MSAINRFLFALLALTAVGSPSAMAHTSGASFLSFRALDGRTILAMYDFDLRDLNQLLQLDRNFDGQLTWGEIESSGARIEASVLERTRLQSNGKCVASRREPLSLADHGEGPFARLSIAYRCTSLDTALAVDHSAWFDFDPGHRALLEYVDAQGRITQTVLTKSSPRWQAAESTLARLKRFVVEGAYHLVTGYDHLAFLGVLLLALARRQKVHEITTLKMMAKRAFVVITAFTIAHSFTLALAASGKLMLPSKPVEITIAISVLLAAVLNLWRGAGSHGWKLAFIFGLVHGLGFAGALAEMASESIDLLSLAAFNAGIEAAQIAIAAIAVPAVWLLFRSTTGERFGLPATSLCVAALAGFWVVARIAT